MTRSMSASRIKSLLALLAMNRYRERIESPISAKLFPWVLSRFASGAISDVEVMRNVLKAQIEVLLKGVPRPHAANKKQRLE